MTDIGAAKTSRLTVANGLTVALLLAVLSLACATGLIGPYVAMLLVGLSLVLAWDGPRLAAALRDPAIRGFLLALALLAVAFVVTMHSPGDLLAVLDFSTLALAVPAFALLSRGARAGATTRIAWLALAGVAIGVVAGLAEIAIIRPDPLRASGGFSAIFYADLGVMLGYLALLGLIDTKDSPRRYWLMLGPGLGAFTIFLGASRGALMVYAALAAVTIALAAIHFRRWRPVLIAAALTVVPLAIPASIFGAQRMIDVVEIAQEAVTEGETADISANYRLEFYQAGIRAFLDSPLAGHGWWRRVSAAVPYMNETAAAYETNYRVAHLHNDLINFGSAAGLLGIVAYLVMLASPIAGAWRSPRDGQYRVRLYGTIGLGAGFFCMGLTDTMFVYELPKTFFIFTAIILVAHCRDREAGST